MRKLIRILFILSVIFAGGYLYLRFVILKAKDFAPNVAKASSPLDLRPSIIAKLQQLVFDGSKGLYRLNIDRIDPDVLDSKVDLTGVTLIPDTAVLRKMNESKQAPDDVYKISVQSVHIDGLGIDQFLHKKNIDVSHIVISSPVINLYHSHKPYNEPERRKEDTTTLYHRIMSNMLHIGIASVTVKDGNFIDHDQVKSAVRHFNDVNISLGNILIDSSTQFATNRFLFARSLDVACKNYSLVTPDSLYEIKIGGLSVSAEKHTLMISAFSLKPRGGNQTFQKHISHRKEMFTAEFPKIILSGTNWMSLMHNESIIADHAEVGGGTFSVYLDRTLPSSREIQVANYPHQLLMKMHMPVSVTSVDINKVNLTYEEYDPVIDKNGKAFFDNIRARITNVTNIPGKVRKNHLSELSGSALFMHHIAMKADFKFNLEKYRTGDFSASVEMAPLDKDDLNPITEPMALFSFKSGSMKQGIAHVSGDNFNSKADVLLLYNDLKIIPYKRKEDDYGKLKKKHFTSFVANTFLIKNNNPNGSDSARHPEYTTVRDHHGNFFNFIWTTILTGILKTVGIPVKFVLKG